MNRTGFWNLGTFVLLGLLVAGCRGVPSESEAPAPNPTATAGTTSAAPADSSSSNRYRIFPGDKVRLSVYGEPDLTSTVTIEKDGSGVFPLVGSVDVGGKTLPDAARLLEKRFQNGYLISPQVTLTVEEYAQRTFTIFGQVENPGVHEISVGRELTLLEAIGTAGGYTSVANAKNVTVKRKTGTGTKVFRLNAAQMAQGGRAETFTVQPNDVITVGESMF